MALEDERGSQAPETFTWFGCRLLAAGATGGLWRFTGAPRAGRIF